MKTREVQLCVKVHAINLQNGLHCDSGIFNCRDLTLDDNLREKQIIAAEKVIKLLRPPENSFGCSTQVEMSVPLSDCTPSMIAAYAILHYQRKVE